jgi:hypothetical protein
VKHFISFRLKHESYLGYILDSFQEGKSLV